MKKTAALRDEPKNSRLYDWSDRIPPEEWRIYQKVLDAAVTRDFKFALGGAFALASYTGQFRNTKDIDLYILKEDKERFIEILSENGFEDYYDRLPYVRSWIYRGFKEGNIVDLIWSFANDLTDIDGLWLTRGPRITLDGRLLQVIPVEELLWAKMYVFQKDRCDWTDIFNLLYYTAGTLDWEHLIRRVGNDTPLIGSMLLMFGWLAPKRAQAIPMAVWEKVGVSPPMAPDGEDIDTRNVNLLDTRPWFRPLTPE